MRLTADRIAKLYDRYAVDVLRFVSRMAADPESAVDLTAETFARVIADRQRFVGDGDEDVMRWIFTIACHLAIDAARRSSVERIAVRRFGWERRVLHSDEHDDIERWMELDGPWGDVEAVLDALPRNQRRALRLRVLEEWSYAEIAAGTGVSEQTARSRVSRALTVLRTAASDHQLGEGLGHG